MKFRNESHNSRKVFAIAYLVIIVCLLFYSPVVKAENDSAKYFNAKFPAKSVPDSDNNVETNLADRDNISTEIDVWEKDLGKEITDGSYIGSIFQSSLFEVDSKPMLKDETFSLDTTIVKPTLPLGDFPPYFSPNFPESYDDNTTNWDYRNDTIIHPKERTIVSVVSIMKFSNRVIMSGATEFWVKLPITPNCIDLDNPFATFSMIQDGRDYDDIKTVINDGGLIFEPEISLTYDTYPYKWNVYNNGSIYDENYQSLVQDNRHGGKFIFPNLEFSTSEPEIVQSIESRYIINDNIYVHVYGTIEPNVNYIVSVTSLSSSEPHVYLTEDDVCSNGRDSFVLMTDINFNRDRTKYYTEDTAWHGKHEIVVVRPDETNYPLKSNVMHMPVDASFSFIFKSGRGSYGMFGHKVHFNEKDSLVYYETLERPNVDKYISIMIPFVSNKQINIRPTVYLTNPDHKFEPTSELFYHNKSIIGYSGLNFWQSEKNLTYTDYILFTIPYKIDLDTIDVTETTFDIKVIITFEIESDVVFMFSTLDRHAGVGWAGEHTFYVDEQTPNLYSYDSNSMDYRDYRTTRKELAYIYPNSTTLYVPYATMLYKTKDDAVSMIHSQSIGYGIAERRIIVKQEATQLSYKLFKSTQLTDGIWHQLVTDPTGFQYADHFFERRVAIGLVEYWVLVGDENENKQEAFYDEAMGYYQNAWDSIKKGKVVDAIYYTVKGTISLMWNGLEALLGWIEGTFIKFASFLQKVGHFIYSMVQSFYEDVLTIIGDIVNSLEKILNPALYIIALLIFMYVIAWSGKFIYNPTGGL